MSESDELTIDDVTRVISAFLGLKCTCILGAGVSAPMVPANLNMRALDLLLKHTDSIEPGMQGRTPASRSWIKNKGYEWSAFVQGAIGQATPQTYRYLEHQITKAVQLPAPPPQYAVFNRIPRSVTVLTYNYDGLATRFCPQYIVREMHGRHSTDFPFGWDVSTLFQLTLRGYDIAPTSLHYFEPESLSTFGAKHYHWFGEALSRCSDLVIIGYSFAQNARELNDRETMRMIQHYLTGTEVRVTVIGPTPDNLVLRLADSLQTNNVIGVPAYWSHLARAISKVSFDTIEVDIRGALRRVEEVRDQYIRYRDGTRTDLDKSVEAYAEIPRITDEEFQAWKNYIDAHR